MQCKLVQQMHRQGMIRMNAD
uniref:Uncharacterized protein n=1 Tax=Arundo donax TaxID=35708 RepID=A0A0A9EMM2_ARUDO